MARYEPSPRPERAAPRPLSSAPPPPPPGHQREGATSLKRLAAGISPQSAGPEASPRGLGVGGRARMQPGGPQRRRPQPLPAASSPSVPAPMESVARAAHVADTPNRLLNGPPKVRRPRWAGALHGDPSHAPRERFSLLSPAAGTRTARQRSEWAGTCSFAQGPEVT